MSDAASSLSALDEFNAAFSRYLVWTSKGQGAATEDRARKVRFELYRVFRKIAKTPQGLLGELVTLGYGFKRRKDPHTAKAVSPEREVAYRTRSLRFLSVSWIFRAWRARRDGQTGTFTALDRAQEQIGEAVVNTAPGTESPWVQLTSFLAGVGAQNKQRDLVDAALRGQAADMAVYIAKKHQEYLQGLFRKRYVIRGVVTIA